MSTVEDLMGLGMPGPLAARIGNSPKTVAGVGTAQTGAAAITTSPCTSCSGFRATHGKASITSRWGCRLMTLG
jgi:hypothetical protein